MALHLRPVTSPAYLHLGDVWLLALDKVCKKTHHRTRLCQLKKASHHVPSEHSMWREKQFLEPFINNKCGIQIHGFLREDRARIWRYSLEHEGLILELTELRINWEMSRISYEAGFCWSFCNITDTLIYLDFLFFLRGGERPVFSMKMWTLKYGYPHMPHTRLHSDS